MLAPRRLSQRRDNKLADQEDFLQIIEDQPPPPEAGPRWKVAVIDDDPAVHDGTRFALSDYTLNGQRLEILSASSAAEGRELLTRHPDVAAVLLDVIMETDSAGLDLVHFIRSTLKNETIRIILRTGQPGQAPERRIIVDYDINDYKAKTELTADKLFTSLTAALRSYQQLQRMVETRRGLEIIVDAASTLYDFKSMQRLAEGVLTQIASLLNVDCAGILVLRDSETHDSFSVLAGSGCYSRFIGPGGSNALNLEWHEAVRKALRRCGHEFLAQRSVLYLRTGSGRELVVLLECSKQLSETDRALVQIFGSRLSVAFDNVILYEQLQQANTHLEDRVRQRTRELLQANTRLSAQWTRLQRANAFKSEVLGTVAHDLKNPLGVILGRTEMLTEMVGDAASSVDNVKTQVVHIRTAAHRVREIIDSLISDAMADALDITIRREPVDLVALLRDLVDANQPLAARKDQTITFTAPAKIDCLCDQDRIREAIDNVLSNAIKYSPIGGRIEVAIESSDQSAVIRISDQGPGLSPEDIARLFGRFQRLSAKPTGGETSTGLGLSIVKRIVDLHGGIVVAETTGPSGTTFMIAIPSA
jgi:signal transduction histidine kinase/DNA-binding NarL/FixJ family response regulator